jgi:hypothetical protein
MSTIAYDHYCKTTPLAMRMADEHFNAMINYMFAEFGRLLKRDFNLTKLLKLNCGITNFDIDRYCTEAAKGHWDSKAAQVFLAVDKIVRDADAAGEIDFDAVFRKAREKVMSLRLPYGDGEAQHEIYTATFEWAMQSNLQLQSNKTSYLHSFLEFQDIHQSATDFSFASFQPFLVQHNWSAAFAGDKEFDNRVTSCHAPAQLCCFEFMVSGRKVLVLTTSDDESHLQRINTFISVPSFDVWLPLSRCCTRDDPTGEASGEVALLYTTSADPSHPIAGLWEDAKPSLRKLQDELWQNIRAACIALEAEVAEIEVVRRSDKVNAARLRNGKRPLPDYSIINLANRKRYAPVPAELQDDETKRQGPRLHFRRGHVRHYSNYQVWIKWQLVGNADTGFIDHDYKL